MDEQNQQLAIQTLGLHNNLINDAIEHTLSIRSIHSQHYSSWMIQFDAGEDPHINSYFDTEWIVCVTNKQNHNWLEVNRLDMVMIKQYNKHII